MVVRQAVTLPVGRVSAPVGSAVKLTARVRPGKPGQPVMFERKVGGTWTLLRAVKLGAGHTASFIWKAQPGASNIRARVAATVTNGAARSAPVTITATGR